MRIEYDKLVRWGEASGLLREGKDAAATYDQKMKNNGNLVVAVLSQLQLLLRDLRGTELKWDYLQETPTAKGKAQSARVASKTLQHEMLPKAGDIAEPNQAEAKQKPTAKVSSPEDAKSPPTEDQQRMLRHILETETIPDVTPKYPRGLDRLKYLASGVMIVTKQPKRFVWAVRAGSQFSSKLSRVQQLVQSLEEMLSQEQLAILIKSTNDFKLDLLQLTTNVEQMKALLESQEKRQSTLAGSTLVEAQWASETLLGSLQQAESRFTTFLNAAIQFSIDMNESQPSVSGSLELGPSDVQSLQIGNVPKGEIRTWRRATDSTYKWIEWKTYTPSDALERVPSLDTLRRIRRLVMLLRAKKKPDEFCVPPCMGFFIDRTKTRIGVVFEAPDASNNTTLAPTSLLARFEDKAASLPARIAMAQRLSQWLLYLHAVNWLHKGLRSANVLFLRSKQDDDQLFVSGFEYSRLSKGDHTTTGPSATDENLAWYIHPSYLGSRRGLGFFKTYDMYSLGIILIELAYWKPIQRIYAEALARSRSTGEVQAGAERSAVESHNGTSKAKVSIDDIESLRSRMLRPESSPDLDILDRIKEIAGLRYYKATKACIEGMEAFELDEKLEQTDPTVGAHLQRAFVEVVVDSLKGIVV